MISATRNCLALGLVASIGIVLGAQAPPKAPSYADLQARVTALEQQIAGMQGDYGILLTACQAPTEPAATAAEVVAADASRRPVSHKPVVKTASDRDADDLPADPVGAGRWKVTTGQNPLNDKAIVSAMLTAEGPIKGSTAAPPTLVVRCQTPAQSFSLGGSMPVQPGLEVYIVTGNSATAADEEGKHQLQVRFDDQPAETWNSSESTDHTAFFIAPAHAAELLVTRRTLATSKRMLVGFTPLDAAPVVVSFDVRGFRTHLRRVLAACPTADRSQGQTF